jgi:hypothetical protein
MQAGYATRYSASTLLADPLLADPVFRHHPERRVGD